MRKIIAVLAVCSFSAYADIPTITPHIADAAISAAALALIDGTEEIGLFGFPGVLAAKIIFEAAAQGYRDAGDKETCQTIAAGVRRGSWFGAGATLGGLAAGPYGLAIGGIGALVFSWDWSQRSAVDTCSQALIVDQHPYSYSGGNCMGWSEARPDFCNSFWSSAR